MMNSFLGLNETERKKWSEIMLQHSFEESEWIEARISLNRLLSKDSKTADEAAFRSYISCCAEAISGSYSIPNLKDIVSDFYKQYGMESAREISD